MSIKFNNYAFAHKYVCFPLFFSLPFFFSLKEQHLMKCIDELNICALNKSLVSKLNANASSFFCNIEALHKHYFFQFRDTNNYGLIIIVMVLFPFVSAKSDYFTLLTKLRSESDNNLKIINFHRFRISVSIYFCRSTVNQYLPLFIPLCSSKIVSSSTTFSSSRNSIP